MQIERSRILESRLEIRFFEMSFPPLFLFEFLEFSVDVSCLEEEENLFSIKREIERSIDLEFFY